MIRLSLAAAAVLIASPLCAGEPSVEPLAAAAAPAVLPSATATPLASQVAEAAPVKKPRLRCRTDYEIGSLVKRTRRCGDADMWRRADDAVRSQTQRMQDDLTARITSR